MATGWGERNFGTGSCKSNMRISTFDGFPKSAWFQHSSTLIIDSRRNQNGSQCTQRQRVVMCITMAKRLDGGNPRLGNQCNTKHRIYENSYQAGDRHSNNGNSQGNQRNPKHNYCYGGGGPGPWSQGNASRAYVLPTETRTEEIYAISATPSTDASQVPTLMQSSEVANSELSSGLGSESVDLDSNDMIQICDQIDPYVEEMPQLDDDFFAILFSDPNSPGLIQPDSSNHVQNQLMTHDASIDNFDDLLLSNQNVLPVPEESRLAGSVCGNDGTISGMIPGNVNQAQKLVESDSSKSVVVHKDKDKNDAIPILQPHSCCGTEPSIHKKLYLNLKQKHETFKKTGKNLKKKFERFHEITGCRAFFRAEFLTRSKELLVYQFGDLPTSLEPNLDESRKRKRPVSEQWVNTSYSSSLHCSGEQGISFPRHSSASVTSTSTMFYSAELQNVPLADFPDPNKSHVDMTMNDLIPNPKS